jgi:ketosteroid isomerase-like protein
MTRLLLMFCLASTMASAQSRTCDVKESERQVREIIQRIMDLRSQQDDRFLSFYSSDEYSFPGESWVFQRQDRAAERTRETKSARQSGETWHTEIRDLHLKAGCDIAWIAGIVHAQQLDSQNNPKYEAEWRLTAILERRESAWLIVHQHSSLPVTEPEQWWKKAQTTPKP